MTRDAILEQLVRRLARGEPVDWDASSLEGGPPVAALRGLRVLDHLTRLGRAERRAIEEMIARDPAGDEAPPPRPVGKSRRAEADDRAWGPLRLREKIGEGSSGEVFRAHDPALQIDVALKLWHADWCSPSSTELLLQEARALARIRHPNILPVLGAASHGGRVGMWTELQRGETLESIVEERGCYGAMEAALVGAELCRALAAVHAAGLVHRDVKTRNVMRAAGGRIVLMDFGSALQDRRDAAAPPDDPLNGTPLTMAPEQLLEGSVGPSADLYGLAVLLYRLVARRYPIEGGSIEELIDRHRRGDRRSLRDLRPDLPADFVRIVERGLCPDPAGRFPSAGAFETALLDFIRDANALQDGTGRARAWTGEAADAAPAPSAAPPGPPNHLPQRRTPFIGREQELAECRRLLDRTRLLTLTGIGGCGKTRLALRLAESLLEGFPDGAWFVDLAPVQDAGHVAATVASVLRVTEAPDTPLIERLPDCLRGRRALIVLDNCEHVRSAVVDVANALLTSSSGLKLIATSREALGVEGESPLPLWSLSVPSAGVADPAVIAVSEAVQLFVDRAQRVDPRFELDGASAPAVADLCRRLDGIPLAIELAAARMKALSVDEIRARLGDRFRLLRTTGGAGVEAHHRTLRATIQWSYDQFSDRERRLFRLLSVFAGGWTLGAAVRVDGDDADELDVLDAMTRMIEKSVLTAEGTPGGVTRYSMLETVRQYAQAELDAAGEGDAARDRHLGFYLALAEEADPKLMGPEQGAWFARLDRERENLLAAHAWCGAAAAGPERGMRLVFAVRNYWPTRGLLELGHRVTAEALARGGRGDRSPGRCHAQFALGQISFLRGRYAEARANVADSLSIARELHDAKRVTAALVLLGMAAQGLSDPAAAREHYEEALALARAQGDKMWLSTSISALAELHRAAGNLDAAEPLYAESVAFSRELGSRQNIALDLANLARVRIGRGNLGPVRGMLLEALSIAEEIGSKSTGQTALDVCAGLAVALGECERAARFYGASTAQSRQMGLHRWPADEEFLAPLIARARAGLSADSFAASERSGEALSYQEAVVDARAWLGPATS